MYRRSVVALSLLMLLSVASLAGPAVAPTPSRFSLAALHDTMAQLDLNNPIADLDRNLNSGDRRFIGINRYSCSAPGVPTSAAALVQKYQLHCLDGTTDTPESSEHEELIEDATRYAAAYNTELLRRIRDGLVT